MSKTNPGVLKLLKGQPQAVNFLDSAVKDPKGGYIFFGPDGVGKRTAAILFAAAVNPPSFSQDVFNLSLPDILTCFPFKAPDANLEQWLEAWGEEKGKYVLNAVATDPKPSWVIPIGNREKELAGTIRDLRRQMKFPPHMLNRRVALLFDFDRIRDEGANAFLKTLEEPQAQTIMILTTSRPFALPATIRSRCKLVRFNELPDEVIREELVTRGYEDARHDQAVDVAFGSLKQALTYLEDAESLLSDEVLDYLENPAVSIPELLDLINKLSFRVGLEKITNSFGIVFRWVIRARANRLPHWPRLQVLVKSLSKALSRQSLVHNIMLSERMSGIVKLNPVAPLFLFRYLTSLRFN